MRENEAFYSLTKLDEALKSIEEKFSPLPEERVDLLKSMGRISAEDVLAPIDVPPFDRAAMDGYAVRACDVREATELRPVRLKKVTGGELGRGEATEVLTGARLPEGADAVFPKEYARVQDSEILVTRSLPPYANVSKKGEDVSRGQVILFKGQRVSPFRIGLLAACGIHELKVVKKPKIGIVPTGEELIAPGQELSDGKIYESNGPALYCLLKELGAEPVLFDPLRDDPAKIRETLLRLSGQDFDLILLIGGSSVGKRDFAPQAISEAGELIFHGVAIRPGAPTSFGIVNGKPVFSLPGFPAGCLMSFELLVKPAVRKMLSSRERELTLKARLTRRIFSILGRLEAIRVKLEIEKGEYLAYPLRSGSSILSSLVKADGLLLVPEDVERIEAGTNVEIRTFKTAD